MSPCIFFMLDPVDCAMSPPSSTSELVTPQAENTSTGTRQCLKLARHWLEECEKHGICRQAVPGMEARPSRLVQIWKSPDHVLKARLCQHVHPDVRYATLSHRWGPDPAIRLQEDNAGQLSQEIPISELEQVFQDAMHVVWNLGLSHIWIDTLCIKQDSPLDWAAQSAEMGAIYKNAVCNIAAAAAAGAASSSSDNDTSTTRVGDGSLFTSRDPFSHFSPHIHIRWPSLPLEAQPNPVSLEGFYILRDSAHWSTHVDNSALNTRGWVAQERELSASILVFSREQIFWKCAETLACETFPQGIPGLATYNWSSNTRSFRNLVERLCHDHDHELDEETGDDDDDDDREEGKDTDDIVVFWNAFVHRYAATNLTRQGDRLPAAFGMAQELLGLMPENKFLAGLWESHLVEGLLWRVDEFDDEKGASEKAGVATILRDFDVPSWSWASLDRAVMCDPHRTYGESKLLATAVPDGLRRRHGDEHQVEVEDGDANPFVTCNQLRVTCQQLLNLTKLLECATDVDKKHGIDRVLTYPDIIEGQAAAPSRLETHIPKLADDTEHAIPGTIAQRKLSVHTRVFPILFLVHWDFIIGLLVNPLSGEENTYSRVGTFEAWFKDREALQAMFRLPEGIDSESINSEGIGLEGLSLSSAAVGHQHEMETICLV